MNYRCDLGFFINSASPSVGDKAAGTDNQASLGQTEVLISTEPDHLLLSLIYTIFRCYKNKQNCYLKNNNQIKRIEENTMQNCY